MCGRFVVDSGQIQGRFVKSTSSPAIRKPHDPVILPNAPDNTTLSPPKENVSVLGLNANPFVTLVKLSPVY